MPKRIWAVWCKDTGRFLQRAGQAPETREALCWTRRQDAEAHAAGEYGFATYAEAKRKDWCEVVPFTRQEAD